MHSLDAMQYIVMRARMTQIQENIRGFLVGEV